MEQIVAAVITAISSIVVAVISNRITHNDRSRPGKREASPGSWWLVIAIASVWMLFAPDVLYYVFDLIVDAFILIPLATIVAAAVIAPPPQVAAWSILAMHTLNVTAMVLTARRGWTLTGLDDVILFLIAVGLNALLAALAARWRRGSAPFSVTEELEKLAALHREGKLTDGEYADAKKLLLDRRAH